MLRPDLTQRRMAQGPVPRRRQEGLLGAKLLEQAVEGLANQCLLIKTRMFRGQDLRQSRIDAFVRCHVGQVKPKAGRDIAGAGEFVRDVRVNAAKAGMSVGLPVRVDNDFGSPRGRGVEHLERQVVLDRAPRHPAVGSHNDTAHAALPFDNVVEGAGEWHERQAGKSGWARAASIGPLVHRVSLREIKATVRIARPYDFGIGNAECARDIEMAGRTKKAVSDGAGPGKHGVVEPDRDGKDFPARAKRIKADDKGVCGWMHARCRGRVRRARPMRRSRRRSCAGRRGGRPRTALGEGCRETATRRCDINEELFRRIAGRRGMDSDLKVATALRRRKRDGAFELSGNSAAKRVASPGGAVMRRSGPAAPRRHPRRYRACAPASARFLGRAYHGEIASAAATHPATPQPGRRGERKVAAISRKLATVTPAAKSGTTMESAPSCRTMAQRSSARE